MERKDQIALSDYFDYREKKKKREDTFIFVSNLAWKRLIFAKFLEILLFRSLSSYIFSLSLYIMNFLLHSESFFKHCFTFVK